MIATAKAVDKTIKSKTTKGEETSVKIILATLNIVKREGMRGVRHRAVASEAGVPLGTTTYHFKNIEELIVSAFSYWRVQTDLSTNPLVVAIDEYLTNNAPKLIETKAGTQELATTIYHYVVDYEIDQIESRHDNRVIELAFYHESLQNDRLREEVFAYWKNELVGLTRFYELAHTDNPEADARITQSVFHQLEREAMMQGDAYNIDVIRNVLRRTVNIIFNAKIGD
ncbi:MAG: DNA-binding transcriptional regulator YbjK [Pseudomonadales bacterium]|jgi:DNA-binding transcriptional regulator YbjK